MTYKAKLLTNSRSLCLYRVYDIKKVSLIMRVFIYEFRPAISISAKFAFIAVHFICNHTNANL